jgi:hypothetical protein
MRKIAMVGALVLLGCAPAYASDYRGLGNLLGGLLWTGVTLYGLTLALLCWLAFRIPGPSKPVFTLVAGLAGSCSVVLGGFAFGIVGGFLAPLVVVPATFRALSYAVRVLGERPNVGRFVLACVSSVVAFWAWVSSILLLTFLGVHNSEESEPQWQAGACAAVTLVGCFAWLVRVGKWKRDVDGSSLEEQAQASTS